MTDFSVAASRAAGVSTFLPYPLLAKRHAIRNLLSWCNVFRSRRRRGEETGADEGSLMSCQGGFGEVGCRANRFVVVKRHV